ncbi:probable cytochrome P450 313a2 [Drosophila eugracilis]|uniref:probable cytochrome P450 313a2 n=1 Tax=Drosophila eugracilis TaxID=29029 RepID=UPI001BDB0B85|nr:probable cytochrome P450 313a2 [Drosophila eugracilis]
MMFGKILIAVCLILWIRFLWNRRKLYTMLLKPSGTMGLPIIGVVIQNILFLRGKMKKRTPFMNKYGSTFLTWMGFTPVVMTRDPNVAREVLLSSVCLNRNEHSANAMALSMGLGLLTLQGAPWMERRKQMNPAFKQNVLLSFFPIFNDESRALVNLLNSYVGKGEIDVLPEIIKWSFRISFQTTVGTDVKEEENFENDTILKSYQSLVHITSLYILLPILRNKIVSKLFGFEKRRERAVSTISKTMDNILDKKMRSHPESNPESEMKIIIERGIELFRIGEMPFEELKSECGSLIVAAFETTAHTVYHTLVLLAMFPECQNIVFKEIKDIFPMVGDFEVTYEDLQKVPYLDRVLNETLRLIPSVPISVREPSEDFRLSNGVVIPKGVLIVIDIFSAHRNPDHWGPEADNFNPDNFIPENIGEKHPFAYIPFSRGKRNCIGWRYGTLSSKLALVKILRNFEVSTSFRYEDLDFVDNLVMKLAQVPRLVFQRRT